MTKAIKISVYSLDRIWIIHGLDVGWKKKMRVRKILSSTFLFNILIRVFIYLFL